MSPSHGKSKAKSSGKSIVVIYHTSCPDGFGAAYAAWKKFGARADYRPVSYSERPLDLRGKEVYFLDLVYKPDALRRVLKEAKRVVVIDHHATAKPSVALVKESRYEMKHSGAVLAWKYFHPKKHVPKLLLHVEDEDLWNFKLKGTQAVNARLELIGFDLQKWDKAVRDFEKPAARKKFIAEGELLAAYRTKVVRRLASEGAVPVRFLGHRVLAVNATRPFHSELGNLLYKIKPPIGIIWQEKPGGIGVSLRSDGTVDVAKIAQRFGGGGHKAAAAFRLPRGAKKPWTYDDKA